MQIIKITLTYEISGSGEAYKFIQYALKGFFHEIIRGEFSSFKNYNKNNLLSGSKKMFIKL